VPKLEAAANVNPAGVHALVRPRGPKHGQTTRTRKKVSSHIFAKQADEETHPASA